MIIFRFNEVDIVVRGSASAVIIVALLDVVNGQGLNETIFMTEKSITMQR